MRMYVVTEKTRARGWARIFQQRSNQLYPYFLLAPALVLIGAVSLYPTLYSFYLALTSVRKGVMVFVGLDNFATILASRQFWHSLQLTLIFGAFYITLTMLISFILALIFNRGLSLGGLCMTLIFIPWVLSEITSGVMWRWMFYRDYGVLQRLIGPLFGNVTLIATPAGAMGVVTAASVWRSTAFTMLLLLAGLQTIPKEVYEAASIDGATKWQAFWKVTWPLLRPTTLVTVVFLSIQVVNAVGMFLAITEGGPGNATEVLPLHMYREAIQYFHFGYGAALSVIMFLINAVLAVVYIRALRSESVWS